ncbi:DUF3883 domain-containing protein [Methanimicrococcus sp. OttesenSCG-928-J09]|nr:DUF3883 domain-containing protein [Methanimicrococcus sp. OttesenSCG-928-J09]
MFFELHPENIIGYKKISDAELGRSESHMTHIGLSQKVLTFLSDRDNIKNSIFIYEDKFDYIDAYFDKIEIANDGLYRSPKTRMGERGCVSIASTIRDITKAQGESINWYLLWFSLKNEKIVFFLFNELSSDYTNIKKIGLNLNRNGAKTIDGNHPIFGSLMSYVETKINENGIEILRDLEVTTQIQDQPNKKYKKYDIDRANTRFKEVGRLGEQLIEQYLSKEREKGQIENFIWHNENDESGYPFDFTIQDCRANVYYLDVKTTGYDFKQKMVFSTQEIEFIASTPNKYCIYRVYKDENDKFYLRICEDCKDLSKKVQLQTSQYKNNLTSIEAELRTAKIAISPEIPSLKFKYEIQISE